MKNLPKLAGIQLVIICAAAALPSAARAQSAFVSATGTFTAAAGAFQNVNFTLAQAGNYTMRTWAYGGGVNAAGQVIPPGGIDSLLTLAQSPGGAVVAQHDNISDADRDALIHQPALPIGSYVLRTERAAPGGNDAWATDLVNGSGSLRVTALPAGSSHVHAVALGATGAAQSTLQLGAATPFNIPGSLDVRGGGMVQVSAGSHSSGITSVRAGARLIVN